MAKDDTYYPPKTLENTVRAPYNFVPFTERQPFMRYTDVSKLPAHDKLCAELLTGEIHLTLTAETPVFVSDGQENADFFRGANGNYMIPGSTIRGMVRENMQILGDGLVLKDEDLEDYQIYYREIAGKGARKPLRKYYQATLGVKPEKARSGKSISIPHNINAGYLVRENGLYRIYPLPKETPVLRVSRELTEKVFGKEKYACTEAVAYESDGKNVTALYQAENAPAYKERGILLFTGKPVQKENHLYVFPPIDRDQHGIDISEADRLSYQADCEARKNTAKAYQEFWKLPEEGQSKPVFYVNYDGHIYFGMARYLRIGHSHSIAEGLPERFRKMQKRITSQNELPLDYPHAVLGFTHNFKDENKKSSNTSYRSRVSFGDFEAISSAAPADAYKTVLGEPKPSFFEGYVQEGKHYSYEPNEPKDAFQLNGFKQYWLKDVEFPLPQSGNEKVLTTLRPMKKGTTFSGTIRFKNLKEDELGLLLWSLLLNDGCYQSIGMGKPYGFGRMSVKLDNLRLFDFAALYSASGFESAGKTAEYKPFIQAYKQFMNDYKSKTVPEVDDRPEIKDFFYLKKTIREDTEMVDYLTIDQKKEPKRLLFKEMYYPLPSVAELREKAEKDAPKYDSAEDATAALLPKFGAKTNSSNTGKSSKKKKK